MYYDEYDYDYEPNYPEVEEIIEEASDKFEKFLKDRYKERVYNLENREQTVRNAEQRTSKLSIELAQKEHQLNERERELREEEEKLYNKFKLEWFKSLGIDWEIGDVGFTYTLKEIKETCSTCQGKGQVLAMVNGTYYQMKCPVCGGYTKQVTKDYDYVVKKIRILEIDYGVRKRKVDKDLKVSVDKSNYLDESNTYLCAEDERGNYSSHYLPEKVFHTEEACVKAAKDEVEKRRMELKKESLYEENG